MILFAGVIVVLAARIRRGTHLMRITLVPVLTVAILHALAMIAGIVARRISPGGSAVRRWSWLWRSRSQASRSGFLAGLSAWRLFENRALRRLAAGFASHPPALSLRETSELLSESMDPSLEILHRPRDEPDGWLDTEDRRSRPSERRRSLRDRDLGGRRACGRGGPRPGPQGRPDVPRRRALLGAEGAGERAPRHGVAQLSARAEGLPRAHHVRRGQGAPANRARPPRRRPAVPGRAADPARAGRRAVEGEPGPRRAAAGQARHRGRRRRSSRSGRWRAGSTRRCWPIAGWARRCALPRCATRFGPPSTRTASGAMRPRSRRRSTSAASRRCRTR